MHTTHSQARVVPRLPGSLSAHETHVGPRDSAPIPPLSSAGAVAAGNYYREGLTRITLFCPALAAGTSLALDQGTRSREPAGTGDDPSGGFSGVAPGSSKPGATGSARKE